MIRACIFDLGGTIVDKFSYTPFLSLKKTFEQKKISIHNNLIYKDMGMDKKKHIRSIINNPYVAKLWFNEYGKYPDSNDINELYLRFNTIQKYNCQSIEILPETKECFQFLKNNNIKIGCTTGFNQENMYQIKNILESNHLGLDSYVSSTCIPNKHAFFTRPGPAMVYKNFENLNITSPRGVIKIDDTNIGIEEGRNADCITIGVARWSTYMKVSPSEIHSLNESIIQEKLHESRKILKESNPNYIIDSLNDLPNIIKKINSYNTTY
tara:strand:+ start:195 stop:995 length:801 start_codon:yes stop_codon:yes gene_type:complete